MDLFDTLVDDILSRNEDLLTLRPVVEKEVFHQEILREMAEAGFFKDLWDILWLHNQSVDINSELTQKKLNSREISAEEFLEVYKTRLDTIDTDEGHKDFLFELRRFLPRKTARKDLEKPEYWTVLIDTLKDAYNRLSTDKLT